GAPRYVGLTVDGEVYAIDMGAFECQTVVAPDLTFNENPVNFWYATVDGEKKDYYIHGEDVVLDFSFLNDASELEAVASGMVIDKFSISFVVTDANGEKVGETVYRYQPESDYCDWLSVSDWLDPNEVVSYARQNLGVLPIGSYTLTITLDSDGEIVERGEEDGSEAGDNNVLATTFNVYEAPSTVVTTDKDVVDPLDGEISLREAVEVYAGSYWYSSTILVEDGTQYVLDDYSQVTVKDGEATISRDYIAVDDQEAKRANDGAKFEYGSSYMTFVDGVVTYPDGTTATYDGENPLEFENEDGDTYVVKPMDYYEYIMSDGQPVSDPNVPTVDVLVYPDGTIKALEHLEQTEFYYGKTWATYYEYVAVDAEGNAISFANNAALTVDGKAGVFQNGAVVFEDGSFARLADGAAVELNGGAATYKGSAFVLPKGEVVEFVAGETLECENGSTIAMSQVDEVIDGVLDLEDGRRLELFGDGTAEISTEVKPYVTFAENLDGATIKVDSVVTIDRDLTIDASDRTSVTVSGANKTNVFEVKADATATIISLSIKNALATNGVGAGIANYGNLSLVGVSISDSKATSDAEDPDVDKLPFENAILTEGVGGAIYNAGTLSIDGGSFEDNLSTFHGGAIYSFGSLSIKSATFEGNEAKYFGGAVYVHEGETAFESTSFVGNEAEFGGAVYAFAGATFTSASFEGNVANSDGGAIYAASDATLTFKTADESAWAASFEGNVANRDGGAIYANSKIDVAGALVAENNEATNGSIIFGSEITVSGDAALTSNVSAAGVMTATGAVALNGALEADGNVATDGSIISGSTITVVGAATLANNESTTGAILASDAVSFGDALTATGDKATAGSIISGSTITVALDATLANNESTTGVLTATGDVALNGALVATGNVATGDGGAIYAGASVTVEGLATLTGNSAANGGAIYAKNVELKNGALLAGNVATGRGGAIYAETLTLVNATVAGNSASFGGGLYVLGSATLSNTIVAGNASTVNEETYETTDENGEVVTATRIVGEDIYVAESGTVTLRNSLLQDAEVGAGELVLVAENRSILGVDPQFNDAANGDYSLKATSPAINAGSNALAGASDVDLAGAPRYVG
ncbi:MAG: hypothetical protein IJ991_13945, partial [Thermoguttaceae bacterium]|nr:hypothetical protein [Thermoguttaceae bacterium]